MRSRFIRVPDLSLGFVSVSRGSSGVMGCGWCPIWPDEAGFRRGAAARRPCSFQGGNFAGKKVSHRSLIRHAAGGGGRCAEKLLASMMKSFPAPRAIRLTGPAGSRKFDPSQGKGGGWRGSGRKRPQILEDGEGVWVGHMAPAHRVGTGRDPARPRTAAIVPDLSMTPGRTSAPRCRARARRPVASTRGVPPAAPPAAAECPDACP